MKPIVYAPYLPATHAATAAAAAWAPRCDAATLSSSLALGENVQIRSVDATAHANLTIPVVASLALTTRDPAAAAADVCLVTIRHGHAGEGDGVTTWVALPLVPPPSTPEGEGERDEGSTTTTTTAWNGRFLANGGGGWIAGDVDRALAGAGAGFASVSTDGGHVGGSSNSWPRWALRPDGDGDDDDDYSINWPALEDFGSRAIVEAVRLGKQVTEAYYGEGPRFSYWNGCSTGGRQGHGE